MTKRERIREIALLSIPIWLAFVGLCLTTYIDHELQQGRGQNFDWLLMLASSSSLGSWVAHLCGKLLGLYMVIAFPALVFRIIGGQIVTDQLQGRKGVALYSALLVSAALVMAFA